MTENLKRLLEQYECCKLRYKYILNQLIRTKQELTSGCTSHMYMLGDEAGRLQGVQIERQNLRDYKFCIKEESRALQYLKYLIKEEQRVISFLNRKKNDKQ